MDILTETPSLMDDVETWLALEGDVSALRWNVYARLQAERPFLDHGGTTLVTKHRHCRAILMDNKSFLSGYDKDSAQVRQASDLLDAVRREKYHEVIDHQLRWLTSSDGTKHAGLRSLASRVFSLRAIETMRERIQLEIDNRLDELADQGEVELISQFAYQLPLTIISEMLDIDEDVRQVIHDAWQCMTKMIGTPPERVPFVIDEVHASMTRLEADLKRTFALRRGRQTTDLLARLLDAAAEEGGDIGEQDIMGVVAQMVIAGHQTTQDTIGNGLYELLRHPDQWRLLCDNCELVPNAVEEVLRFHTPGQMAYRTAAQDIEIEGHHIAAGSHITCLLGAANRDREIFSEPQEFDATRPNAKQHLAFGLGVHHCLGASLARMEAISFFTTVARRFPDVRLVDRDPGWLPNNFLHGLAELRVELR
ncbi:MAG: cytochrome P450 [Sphingomonadaceae bacterium]